MKLFTKSIDKKLFAQFPKGGNLEGQKVVAKVFNPYGRGRWYIMNSDPDDPDYLWGIVELFEGQPEVGSFSRSELENIKVGAFKLPLERDMYFDDKNAMEIYQGLKNGKRYADGGKIEDSGYLVRMAEEYAERENEKPVKKGEGMAKATKTDDGKYKYTQVTVFYKDGEKEVYEEDDFEDFFDVDEYAKGGEIGDKVKLTKGGGSETIFRNFPEGEYEIKRVIKGNKSFPEGFYEIENKDGRKAQFIKSRFSTSTNKGGKLNYTSKRNIANVTITYQGKEYVVSGDNVITGAYKFSKGGLSDTHIYIPKRDVLKVTTKEGESIKSPLNGVWVKKEYFDGNEAKGSGKYEPSQATKVFAYKLTELAKDKELKASTKDSMIISLSVVEDFENDLKYEIENNISGLAIKTYANAVKSTSKKNKGAVGKDLTAYNNPNVIDLFPEEFINTPILSKKAISLKGNVLNNQELLKEINTYTSQDKFSPAMTSINVDGNDVVATNGNYLIHLRNEVDLEKQNLCMSKLCSTLKGQNERYPAWRDIIVRDLNDSKYNSQTFDLNKLINLTNWINNYYSVTNHIIRQLSVTTKNGEITFNSELLLQVLSTLKVMGIKNPIMYYERPNRGVYFGENGKLKGDPNSHNYILLMPLLAVNAETFSLNLSNDDYKISYPEFEYAKGGAIGDGKQLELFAKGGATFDDKVRAIKRNLVGKKVPSKYQKQYGKRYDNDEAEESARRIAGAMNKTYKK